jgi:AsmA protein
MKLIKYLIISVVVLLVIFIAGAVVLVTTFDPNDYKEQIVSAAKEATGRDLTLSGDLGFTFFPKLGVKLGQASLSNAKGFGEQTFASVDKVSVSVDLLALLKAEVKADTIELKGLNVNLQKNKNGKTNWDDLAGSSSDTSAKKESKESGTSSAAPALGLEVAGIRITESQIVFDDQQAGNKITLNPIDIKTGSIGSGKPSSISVQLGMVQTNPPMTAEIDLNTDAKLNIETAVYQLTNLVLDIKAKGKDLPDGEVELAIKTNMDAHLKNESLKLAPVEISVAGLKLDGDLSVQSFSKPKISFSLHSDKINLDELIPATTETTATTSESVAASSSDEKIELPVDTLRSLNIDGSLNIGTLIVSGLTMQDLSATVTAKDGVINLNPLTINLYEGTYLGSAGINVRGAVPAYTASSELKNLAIAGLLEDLSEDGKSIIRGKSELAFKVTTSGDRVSTLKNSLNGTASFKASNGALQSEKLARNVEKVVAFLKGREPAPAGEELVFDSLTGTAKINNGVAKNNDMKLITPLVYADGAGDINIGNDSLDYRLDVGLSDEPDRAAIPLSIKGPFEDPKFGIDFDAALKAKKDELVEEKKEEIKEKIDEKIQDKLGDKVGDKLKGLKLF